MEYSLKQLDPASAGEIRAFFKDVFTREPWNDDWSDEEQLRRYILDLIGQDNSLTFGFFLGGEMVALSMGRIKHWYTGTEYCIDELCVRRDRQGRGVGTAFLRAIEDSLGKRGMKHIFLQTERSVPAYRFYKKNGFSELADHVSLAKTFGPRPDDAEPSR